MKKYVILVSGFVGDSHLFWREGHCGYTIHIDDAHKFSKEQANKCANKDRGDEVIEWSVIEKASTRHVTEGNLYKVQKELQS